MVLLPRCGAEKQPVIICKRGDILLRGRDYRGVRALVELPVLRRRHARRKAADAAEKLGVPQADVVRHICAHAQPADGAVPLVLFYTVGLLYVGNTAFDKHPLIAEVAQIRGPPAEAELRIVHDHDKRLCLARGDEVIHRLAHSAGILPAHLVVASAVLEVQHRVFLRAVHITGRRVNEAALEVAHALSPVDLPDESSVRHVPGHAEAEFLVRHLDIVRRSVPRPVDREIRVEHLGSVHVNIEIPRSGSGLVVLERRGEHPALFYYGEIPVPALHLHLLRLRRPEPQYNVAVPAVFDPDVIRDARFLLCRVIVGVHRVGEKPVFIKVLCKSWHWIFLLWANVR